MKTKLTFKLLCFCFLPSAFCLSALAQGTAFTYQGRLNNGGSPSNGNYDFRFRLSSDSLGNNYVGSTVLTNGVVVGSGLFTVTLDFGANFPGADRWLEIGVRTNGGGGYATLSPLQALTPTPYAIFAASASNVSGVIPSGGLSGSYSNAVSFNNANGAFSGAFTGNGTGLTDVSAATLGGLNAGQFWKTAGNSNTVAGADFLGTADNQPLELRVNGLRGLRLEPTANTTVRSNLVNVVNGSPVNFVAAGVRGATIGGGGAGNYDGMAETNSIAADVATIAGGAGNTLRALSDGSTIGGGSRNSVLGAYNVVIAGGVDNTVTPTADEAAIGGGDVNKISSPYGTIGGGAFNSIGTNSPSSTISGGYSHIIKDNTFDATIGGGSYNSVGTNSYYSTIAGGRYNSIGDNATASTIPGGCYNSAYGNSSFAAGYAAQANHDGAFVWSDASTDSYFASTSSNQFNIRANGGVRFVTGGAGMTLDGPFQGSGSSLTNLNAANISSGTLADARLSANVALRSGGNAFTGQQTITSGNVGIGTTSPQAPLHVRGAYGSQLVVEDNVLSHSWSINNDNNDNLVFVPNTGFGGYIYRGNGNYFSLSDLRLKRDITPLGRVLERVLQLRPVSYHFRSAPAEAPLTLGFIAQEVEPLFPEMVGEGAGMKSLAYSELIPVTIRAVQELNEKMDSENAKLREELKRRDTENAQFKQRLETLEKIIRNQKSN